MLAGQRRFLPRAPLSSKGCSARTRARQSRSPTTIPWVGGRAMAGCGVGRPVVCSKSPSGGGLRCSGVTTLLGPGYPPAASMTRTILRNEPNCQSHRHHHSRLQQSVHSDINGSFGSNTMFEGQHPFTSPPGRTTVEDLILEFHRMPCHTLQACNTGAQPRETEPTPSPPTQCARTQHVHVRSTGAPLPDPPARPARD